MRFLLEFASCCGCAPPRSRFSASSSSHYGHKRRTFGHRRPRRRSPPSYQPCHVVKRRRLAAPGEWRPTLVTIYEDDHDDDEVETRSEKQGKRMGDASKALHYYDYDSRKTGGSKIITVVYAMPYMF